MNVQVRISEPEDMTTAELRNALKWTTCELERAKAKREYIVAEMDRRGMIAQAEPPQGATIERPTLASLAWRGQDP